jgi:hypothetical protein
LNDNVNEQDFGEEFITKEEEEEQREFEKELMIES